jgi:alkylhydroperoxidase family enzyme
LPPLSRADITPEAANQLRASFPPADRFFADGSDAPPMPPILGLLARHPDLAGAWLGYNGALLERGALDARTRELLILETVRRTGSAYLWDEHLAMGEAAGLSKLEIDALTGLSDHVWSESDDALVQAVEELVTDRVVSDGTWELLSRHLDGQQLLEMLFVVGTYTCLAMVLNSTGLTSKETQS